MSFKNLWLSLTLTWVIYCKHCLKLLETETQYALLQITSHLFQYQLGQPSR